VAATTIDAYLATVPDDKRAALERLRQQIRAVAPDATEAIAYGMPAFKLDGRYLVGFSATREHCSLYAGRAPVVALAHELGGYRVWRGTINFRPDRPLPQELVEKLIRVRLEEYRAPPP
jgi:uncharacterized protein YdhG (YjbR/CyaY superfamily)